MSEQSPLNTTTTQLPSMSIIKEAFLYVGGERRNFLAMALLPVVALSLIGSIALHLYPDPLLQIDEATSMPQVNLVFLPLFFVSTLFYVMFAVAWHRKWLLGESDITIYSALKWDNRKSKFFFRLVQIFGLSFGVMMGLNILLSLLPGTDGFMLSPFGTVLALAILTLIFARLSLLLPAASVDDAMDIKGCWARTNGNGWRLGVLAILPPIPLAIVNIFIHLFLYNILEALGMSGGLFAQLMFLLFEHILNYVGIAVGVSALSMAYIWFKENESETENQ